MLIFTIPKEFVDPHTVRIQTNAILSWKAIGLDIILFGEDKGVADFAKKHNIQHIPEIRKNEQGTPLVSDAFKQASQNSNSGKLIYANSDIILTSEFKSISKYLDKDFLAIGQRLDFDIDFDIDFSNKNWEEEIIEFSKRTEVLHNKTGIDVFVHSRYDWDDLPDLAVGRAGWDNLVVFRARERGFKVIDFTSEISILHQNHGHSKVQVDEKGRWSGVERDAHLKELGNNFRTFTIADCNYKIENGELRIENVVTKKKLYYLMFTPEIYIKLPFISSVIRFFTHNCFYLIRWFHKTFKGS